MAKAYKEVVGKRTWLKISESATPSVRAALEAYRTAIQRIGKGTGVKAARYRQDARRAADQANIAIPCWIMPHYRVSESLPSGFGLFDLVIIDEASQSDLTALPSIFRAKKVLIVGDDKQVSPEGIGLQNNQILNIMAQHLSNQVELYRPLFAPDRSIYDLFKVVFAKSSVMLKEHFRCIAPIIEYSRREFYNGELKPLRLPKASERLDPPLVDVYLMDGCRVGKKNPAEARFIVDEIRRIVENPAFAHRSIGVVSLLGTEQALTIMEQLNEKLGEEVITRHEIACGDARTFQGKERDIMFLSMVVVSGNTQAQTRDTFAQRLNVAASRARDRMYLVRSIEQEDLSPSDTLRAALIQHFKTPFTQAPKVIEDLRELCESPFECEVFDVLTQLGYRVTPQVPVGAYRIDMVVEGDNDHRLAIECDGDQHHGPEKWDADMRRQRILERAGWRFWRSFASTFVMRRDEVIKDLVDTLSHHGIRPTAGGTSYVSIHVESRRVSAFDTELCAQHDAPEISDAPDLTEIAQDDFELVAQEARSVKPMKLEQETLRLNTPQEKGEVDEVLLIKAGDIVRYIVTDHPQEVLTVQITRNHNDFDHGIVAASTPLGQVLLGLSQGDESELRIPGAKSKTLRVLEIFRQK